MIIRVIDFETTGLPPDAAVCEAGWYDVMDGEHWLIGASSFLIDPGRAIPPEASAIHHITDVDVAGAPDAASVFLKIMERPADIFAAHNAAFERAFFAGGDKPWICTLKVARRVWPDAPSHSNQTLRYWKNLPLSPSAAMPPHRAQPDAYVTAWILRTLLLEGVSIADMVHWTNQPSLLPRVTFGKHRGKSWSELPVDYLDWLVGKSDMDEDTKFTARHHLKLRAA